MTPSSTYRLQLRPGWGFDAAIEVLDVLCELGISHVYLSPVLQAAPGSDHGYDVTDPSRVDAARGGSDGRDRFVAAARGRGLGIVQDIVPNHVALVTPHNPWWWDVLSRGRASRYADHFDIDWDARGGRVLVPVLGASLADELAAGTLRLGEHDGQPAVHYHDHVFPLAPGTDLDRSLDDVLDDQHYELAHWRRASTELNLRRFFDITSLGGVRVEDPAVFDAVHGRIIEWVEDGSLDGLRIDHPDGLRDPQGYAERLRGLAPDAWIVVEKILEPGEPPPPWPVDGTVGYAFCNQVLGLLVDPAGEAPLTDLYAQLTGEPVDWPAVAERAQREVVAQLFAAEVARLGRSLSTLAAAHEVEASQRQLHDAIAELLVAFPVYRTYVRTDPPSVRPSDAAVVRAAVAAARDRRPDLAELLELLQAALTLELSGEVAAELAARFQQTTGPVMAKGVEDTALYRYLRLTALNEVGGDPSRFGVTRRAFHEACTARHRDQPTTMLLTSTHDTKRAEDVRARLAVLSEIPDRWGQQVRRWFDRHRRIELTPRPGSALAYLLYQTVVGAWPIGADRLVAYLTKAAREAKQHTDWHDPDAAYERTVAQLATTLLDDDAFRDEVDAFVGTIADAGWSNGLAQVALKLTSPGVPDVYQGCELWDRSLVDPDNRRPVDFAHRRELLRELDAAAPERLWDHVADGLPKLALTRSVLRLRRDRPELFGAHALHVPLAPTGDRERHAIAYLRGERVAVVASRLTTGLGPDGFRSWDWGDTTVALPDGQWQDVTTGRHHAGGTCAVSALLTDLPVSVLVRGGT